MDYNEFNKLVSKLKNEGLDDEGIMNVFLKSYERKVCSLEDFEIMVHWLGFELTDDFYKSHRIKKTK